MKRFFVFALTLFMLLPAISACADQNTDGTDGTTTPYSQQSSDTSGMSDSSSGSTAETTRLYPELPDVRYDGTNYTVLYYDAVERHGWCYIPNDIQQDSDDGETLAAGVYKRNLAVGERFGVSIKAFVPQGVSMANTLSASIMAGDDEYAMVDVCMNQVGTFFNKGLLTTIDELDIDYTQPWFDRNSIDSFTIGGKRLAFVSDITYFDKLSTIVTLYNAAMGQNLGIGSLYETALSGDFTLEKVLSYAEQVSADLNHDGVMDKNDAYCISCQNDGAYFLLHSSGMRIVENDGRTMTFNLNNERGISTLEKIYGIMSDTSIYFNRRTAGITTTETAEMFANNQTLFMMRPLQTLYDLRSLNCNFEILPMPRFSADQTGYFSPVNTYSGTCLCVPKGSKDYERTAVITEALAAESYYQVMPVLYDVVLDIKLTNSPESARILDIVFDTRIYDIGMMWDIGSVRSKLVVPNLTTVASTVKSIERVAENGINSLLEQMEAIK